MATPSSSLRVVFRGLLATSLVTLAVLVAVPAAAGFDASLHLKALMTCLGVAVGAFLAYVLVGALIRAPRVAIVGLVTLAISQVCFYLLWWSPLTQQPTLWRVWWVALVAAVTAAARVALVHAEGRPDWLPRATGVCAVLTGLLLTRISHQKVAKSRPLWHKRS